MIQLEGVTKILPGTRRRPMLSVVNLTIPSDRRIAIFSTHAPSLTALIKLLSERLPDAGRVVRHAHVSMPIPACIQSFRKDQSSRQNARYAARINGAKADEVVNFLEKFADLGHSFDLPFSELSLAQQVFVGMALAYSIPFDVYLIDGPVARGELSLRRRLVPLFEARAKDAGVILATSDIKLAKKYCDMGGLLHAGKLVLMEDLGQAISLFQELQNRSAKSGGLAPPIAL